MVYDDAMLTWICQTVVNYLFFFMVMGVFGCLLAFFLYDYYEKRKGIKVIFAISAIVFLVSVFALMTLPNYELFMELMKGK